MFKKIKNLTLIGATVLAVTVSAQEEPQNYVELGTMKTKSSFDVIGGANNIQVPIFNKADYESQALGVSRVPASGDKKPKEISALERQLSNLKVIPIPKYNFGKEKVLKRKSFGWDSDKYKLIGSFSLKKQNLNDYLQNINQVVDIKLTQADKKEIKFNSVDQTVVQKYQVDEIKMTTLDNYEFTVVPMQLREPKDHDLLAADILFTEKDSCEEVVPISQYLTDKKTEDNRVAFYRGYCLHEAKMFSESIPLLSQAIGTSSDYYAKKAVDKILDGLPTGYEGVIADSLAPKNVYSKLDQKQKDKYNYILAKGNFINEKYDKSEAHAKLVSENSPDYYDAQFLVATSQYMAGKLRDGIITMAALQQNYDKKDNKRKDFVSLINITYARFLFERGSYKEAIENYDAVSREHPLWVDSLIEKGWSQIKLGDYAGAIGNMFTLHSPFFYNAFIPESYVIRTIGYLNLCQFGDADATLKYLETRYPEEKTQVENYIKNNNDHYATLIKFLESDQQNSPGQDGVPNAIIKEMGRDKDYLVMQKKLNNIVDEIPMFRKFASKVMDKRLALNQEITDLSEKSKELKLKEGEALKNGEDLAAKEYKSQRRSIFEEGVSLKYRIEIFDKGIVEYKKANGDAVARAEKLRDGYLKSAETALQASMQNLEIRLNKVLTNNDLLRYEIFANSGKNIRFRVAGGEVKNESTVREPAGINTKDYGWKFKGEFWEDEIGNFKSTIKDMCPK